jgi:DNA-binding transcriptional LysR family regulator
VARRIAGLGWVTCASPAYLRARGRPAHPSDLVARGNGGDASSRPGHVVAGDFSSLTGRPFPLHFQRGGESLVIEPQAGRGAEMVAAAVVAAAARSPSTPV